jgi:hypothetical protein
MLCAAIPASIVSTKYTKSIYSLSLEQLCANRQKNYIQSISTSKHRCTRGTNEIK